VGRIHGFFQQLKADRPLFIVQVCDHCLISVKVRSRYVRDPQRSRGWALVVADSAAFFTLWITAYRIRTTLYNDWPERCEVTSRLRYPDGVLPDPRCLCRDRCKRHYTACLGAPLRADYPETHGQRPPPLYRAGHSADP